MTQQTNEEFLEMLRQAFPGQIGVKIPVAAKCIGISESGMRKLVEAGIVPTVLRPTTGNLRQRPMIDLRPPAAAEK